MKRFKVEAVVTVRIPVSYIFTAENEEDALDQGEESGVFEEIWCENIDGADFPEVEVEDAIELKD